MAIITIASNKGGVGKTTLAIELAYGLEAILVDLDHDAGGATASWAQLGPLAPEYARRSFLQGDGPGPRVVCREGLPALIPAHPDYGDAHLKPQEIAERLVDWAARFAPRHLVVDTHPGFNAFTVGAMAAAHTTVIPVLLQERELTAFRAMLDEFTAYPLATFPNRVPRWGDYQQAAVAPLHARWKEVAVRSGVRIGPTVSEWREWPRRKWHRSLLAASNPGEWVGAAQAELRQVTEWVGGICRG